MLLKELCSQASPLNDQQIEKLQQIVATLSPGQVAWVSGYFWGLSQASGEMANNAALAVNSPLSNPPPKLTILYASQTGNVKEVAKALDAQAKANGFVVSLLCCDDYKPRNLVKETHLIFITSTHGEGDAPDEALTLLQFLQSKKAPTLNQLHYAVLGLGDSSYEFFCQAAKNFDGLFAALGGKPLMSRLDCDVDYQAAVEQWSEQALGKFTDIMRASQNLVTAGNAAGDVVMPLHGASAESALVYNKQHPFSATIVTNQKITGADSTKDVRHLEIGLDDSNLIYQPGDTLGLYYLNRPELVDEILAAVSLTGDENVEIDGVNLPLRQALLEKFEITASFPQQVAAYASLSGCKALLQRAKNKEKLRQYANQMQLIDVLGEKKTALSVVQLLSLLRKLTPRLYSIASSQREVGNEVHITVALVAFEYAKKRRFGAASGFIAQRANSGDVVRVYIESNDHFRLPIDDTVPIIMIGPGTGIAPFRAFMQERDVREATGKNWLFFGDRTFTEDFLYQIEWQRFLKDGLLTQLDLAFSRDQKEKVYVQHRILGQAKALWQWLQDGAHIYVCGDSSHMATDVHEALLCVIEQQGNKSRKDAESYLNELRKMKRYQKDVY